MAEAGGRDGGLETGATGPHHHHVLADFLVQGFDGLHAAESGKSHPNQVLGEHGRVFGLLTFRAGGVGPCAMLTDRGTENSRHFV